jgi:hypothetical protein
MRQRAKWEKKVGAIHSYHPTFFLGEMSDFPGVASYTWKNILAWLTKVSLRGELAIWINYSSSNLARKHNLQ